MIVTTPNLQVRTMKLMLLYLEKIQRIDRDDWKKLNPTIIAECIASGRKAVELTQLYKLLTKQKFTDLQLLKNQSNISQNT